MLIGNLPSAEKSIHRRPCSISVKVWDIDWRIIFTRFVCSRYLRYSQPRIAGKVQSRMTVIQIIKPQVTQYGIMVNIGSGNGLVPGPYLNQQWMTH